VRFGNLGLLSCKAKWVAHESLDNIRLSLSLALTGGLDTNSDHAEFTEGNFDAKRCVASSLALSVTSRSNVLSGGGPCAKKRKTA
jgi:hypothetical protein